MRYLRTKSGVGLVLVLVLLASVALLRADPGDLDLTFGDGDGYVITDFDQSDWIEEMVIDSNNRIVAVGGSSDLNDYQSAIIRYNPDGTLDQSFGDQGLVWLDSPIALDNIALDNSGRIVVIGHDGTYQGLVARFNADGTADWTFGNAGIVIDPNWYEFYALRITPDNKITVIGDRVNSDEALTRYQANGDLDTSFGDAGIAIMPNEYVEVSRSLLATEDGGTLVVGNTIEVSGGPNPQTPDIFLAKYTIDGDLDVNFGNQGSITTSVGLRDYITQAVIDSENRIIVVGSTSQFTTGIVVRYLPDGNIDTTFGADGVVLTEIPDMEFFSNEAVTVDESDRTIVMGMFGTNLHSYDYFPYIARYSLDGSLDTTFGGGTGITQSFLTEPHVVFDGSLDSQGNIVVAGATLGELHFKDILLARFQGGDLPATATPTPTDTATETIEPTATLTPTQTATDSPTLTATATDATSEPTMTSTPDGSLDLLVDGGFEAELTGWQVKNLTLDKVKCDKPEKPVAYEGNCAFRFKGSVGENSQLFQKPELTGQTFSVGDEFTLEAYIKAKGQVDFQAQAKFTYADDTKAKIALKVNAATDGYTVFADAYALTDASLVKVKVTLKHKSVSGKIDVDAVSLNYAVVAASRLLPLP